MKFAKHKIVAPWLVTLLFLGIMAPVTAADALLPPQKVIQEASDKLQIQLRDKAFISDFRRVNRYVEEVIDPHVDFDRISQFVLGQLWRNATPDQRERFKKEFRTLLIRTYSRAFTEFKDWNIRYLPLRLSGDERRVVVRTEVLQPGMQPVAVNYRMYNDRGVWKAYDIIIEGVSLVTNYRTSFKSEVERSGSLESVIEQLATRNSQAFHGSGLTGDGVSKS